jgi:hypothetical protein
MELAHCRDENKANISQEKKRLLRGATLKISNLKSGGARVLTQ